MNPGARTGDDNDSGEGEHHSPGHESGSSIHSRGGWSNRSIHPHQPIGPHDAMLDLPPGMGHPGHPMVLAYPERYNQLAWPPLSPLGSKPPGHHHLHHRASWGGVPSLAPISAEDPRQDEMGIAPSTSWGGAGPPGPPMIPKLETIKLETSTTPPNTTPDGWYMSIGADSGNGPFHHPQSAGVNRNDVYHPLPTSMASRPWSASGSSGESDTNTHSGSIHSAHQSFDPTMVTGAGPGPGPAPTGEYYPSPTSAHSSLYFPPPLHSAAPTTPIGSAGAQAGAEGSIHPSDCPPHSFEDEHPYAHPHTHTHTPPPSFGSAYLPQSRTPSAYEMLGPRHAIRRDSTGLEPPFGMH